VSQPERWTLWTGTRDIWLFRYGDRLDQY
jgi:hypothetical protein